jgi:tetratricopeptide (TPR) repeat protein
MKTAVLFSLGVLLTPLAAQNPGDSAATQVKDKAGAGKVELLPNQQAFLNLPKETRTAFAKHLSEANRIFQQKRIVETLEELDKAAAIFVDSPEIFNLRGSCYVEMRAFDKALAAFTKAATYSKDNPSIEFNIGETYFCTKQWQKALDFFEKVLKKLPPENITLGRLVEFKILLCKKKLGKKEEAAALAEKYDYLDDSPFYYYANAAIAYDDNNKVKAEEWLGMASRIFRDPQVTAAWQDTLVEFGYIKSFYGQEDAPSSE